MKLSFRSLTMLSCLLVALPIISGTANAQSPVQITESKLLAIIANIDKAARRGNVAGLVAPIARDAKIKLTISVAGNSNEKVFNLTRDQYALHTKQGLRRRLGYTLERKNLRVKVYDDGQTAMVTADLYETLTIKEGTLRAVTSEVTIFRVHGARILATSSESRMRIY